MTIAAIIVAAGRGTRAGSALPKQWHPLLGRRVIDWTLDAFRNHPDIDKICVVLHPDDIETADLNDVILTTGGATRDASVKNGLDALVSDAPGHVLIHDAARATISDAVISDVIHALATHEAAAPALPVTDALWTGANGLVTGTRDRSGLFRAQTPQGFAFSKILNAHQTNSVPAADDVEIARRAGMDVAITQGCEGNLKVTYPEDFARAEAILRSRQ
ncbi:2-C-methyl-D-erythritol 4-phosphate cytidylyltransferase [Rhodobacteraceae bacterium HIMB11]|nr:2-C-methyl-D-erythritol 4-phosphate cytidylyltransferase [Rhodobacteraceae bacterium HIMB11]